MKTRVVLYGTKWAENHLRAYQLCRHAEVAGLVGYSNRTRLDELADTYSISARYMDLADALDECKPQVLDVCCNPHFRLQAVEAVIGTSVRHVNLQKPMALKPSEAYEIERLCKENHLTLTVNHQKKFNAPWARAQKIIADGKLGAMRFFRATCQCNLLEQGTHLVDMLLFFHNFTDVAWVMGQVDDLEGLQKPASSAPDAAVAQLQFTDGVRAHMAFGNVGWDLPETDTKCFHMGIEAYGSKGHLAIALNQKLTVVTYDDGQTHTEPSLWDETFLQGLADQLDHAALYGTGREKEHISCLENSMKSFEAIMAIYESATGGGRVTLPRRFDDTVLERLDKR